MIAVDNKTMGRLIADRRKALNMTQKQLADRLGVTDRAVSRWERGVGAPEISLLPPLAAALNITTDELLGSHTPTQPPSASTYTPTKIGIPMFFYYVRSVIAMIGLLIILFGAIFQTALSHPILFTIEITGIAIMALCVLSMFLFYRCPRCGHFLEGFNPRASQYQTQHCRTCGQHLYSDKTVRTLTEYLKYKKSR